MQITQITGTPVMIPYAAPVGPYIGRGRTGGTLGGRALVVKVETDSGLVGWGEGTGEFGTDPAAALAGAHPADIEQATSRLEEAGLGKGPLSGIEMALWDLVGKEAGLPLCRLLGGMGRTEVDYCACMGLKEPAESADTARAYVENWGFRYIKTKAGDNAEQDLAIARAIQAEVGDRAVLRPDANAGYTPEQAEPFLRALYDIGVRYFEDPCSTEHTDALSRFRHDIGMNILVNMGLGSLEDVRRVLQADAADALMPDTPVQGGLHRVQKVSVVAEAWKVPCLMHCAHDLGLKTAAIAHLAAATPNFSGPSDTCYHGLVDDVLAEPLVFNNGRIGVPTGPGLGVEVDEAKVEKYRVT